MLELPIHDRFCAAPGASDPSPGGGKCVFAAAEFSLVSVRDTRIQQLIQSGRIGARIVQRLHQHLDEVVNGVQLGITMVSLTLGWIGEPMVARLVEALHFVHEVPHAAVYAHGIAIVIAFSLITYLHVLLGELVPKTLALQRAEQIALAVAGPMEAFLTLTRPLLFLCAAPVAWFCGFLGRVKLAAVAPCTRRTNLNSSSPLADSSVKSPSRRKK